MPWFHRIKSTFVIELASRVRNTKNVKKFKFKILIHLTAFLVENAKILLERKPNAM